MSWRWTGNVRTSKSWTSRFASRDAELGRRLAHLARERVRREALGQRLRGDRERDVPDLDALLDEPRHRPAAAELPVVGVRREDERPFGGTEHCRILALFTLRNPAMTHETLAEIAALAGAAGAALVVLGAPRRLQLVAGLVLLAAAEAMLTVGAASAGRPRAAPVREGGAALVAGAARGRGAGAWAFVRWPSVVPGRAAARRAVPHSGRAGKPGRLPAAAALRRPRRGRRSR